MAGYNPTLVTFGLSSNIEVGEVGGTRDYNKLNNTPIKNLTGEQETPIELSALEPGRYALTGFYIADETVEQGSLELTVKDLNEERLVYYIEMTYFDLKAHLLRYKDGVLQEHRAQSMLGASFKEMEGNNGG